MAKTRGGLSASPSSPTPRPHQAAMGGAASPTVQAPAIPPSEGGTPSQRRYPTRRPPTEPVPPADQAQRPASRPLRREPSSRVLESHPMRLRQSRLQWNLGFLWRLLPRLLSGIHDSRTTDRGQLGLQRSILPLRDLL
ncbi:hypothetical protein CK203_064673 [Vitis vinifera]|uniref:Uncharacterized protein n=1 Tax=Vitis vinifera TaxID=29760 RepID=A0A438FQ61_VITVI|nr:hypothetical protein CK203_064673 [Vitis vinifera]